MAELQASALNGLRVLEFAGIAPGPYAGLLLAENGASVLRIDRAIPGVSHCPGREPSCTSDVLAKRKSSIALNLKSSGGIAFVKSLIPHVDIIIDPYRPGVLEKLGLGPDVLQSLNERIIIGRITGFRRDGRYQTMAGHDINYLAVSGVLSLLGRRGEKPLPPANLLGDFAGGGAVLFQGILLALLIRERTGQGQIVEANMVDGSSHLATFPRLLLHSPMWNQARGENILDGGCPWYDTYMTKDTKYMAVGALEPQFFKELLLGLGLAGRGIEQSREDRTTWPYLRSRFADVFRQKTRSEWEKIFAGTDACCTPVLDFNELRNDPNRDGDQRAAVSLRNRLNRSLASTTAARRFIVADNENQGCIPTALYPGQGGQATLSRWLGWKLGLDYEVQDGGLIVRSTAKL